MIDCILSWQVLSEAKEMVARREEAKEKRRLELKELRKQSKENKVAQLRGQSYEVRRIDPCVPRGSLMDVRNSHCTVMFFFV